jgi:phosphoglycerate dehydrogenase-like enzyme
MNGGLGINSTIGVIGFGRFGRLAARYLAPDGRVRVWDAESKPHSTPQVSPFEIRPKACWC